MEQQVDVELATNTSMDVIGAPAATENGTLAQRRHATITQLFAMFAERRLMKFSNSVINLFILCNKKKV